MLIVLILFKAYISMSQSGFFLRNITFKCLTDFVEIHSGDFTCIQNKYIYDYHNILKLN